MPKFSCSLIFFQIDNVPPEVSRRGHEEMIMFVKHLQNGKRYFFHGIGMVVGCSGSGKSSLLKRIQTNLKLGNHETRETRAVKVYEDMFSIDNGRLNGNYYFALLFRACRYEYFFFFKMNLTLLQRN